MKRNRATLTVPLLALAALVLCAPATAGVVYEIEVTDHDASPPRTEGFETSVEGKNLKMGVPAGNRGGESEMIFRGDRREMVVVDHNDKSYTVIDDQAIEAILGQLDAAAQQIQEALKNVPEDQRAMVEKMMKERMPNVAAAPAPPATEVRRSGERAEKAGYPCVRYDVTRGGTKVRELWVTDWDNVEGGKEVVGAFESMSDFFRGFREALQKSPMGQMGGGGFDDNMFEQMKELNGFPVVTREFDDNGNLESESTLRSANRRALDPAEFEPPAGYKRRQMFGG